ncbi:hypothetical protein CEXT_564471 [Caerostris extrusa]|uniref:Secreted protein n=1 Tax=Caerostris extrusa TaxID=172846 RepID=A0AAV4WZ50_CAEEX|nr:hypothetical protein CEXT_564471 [Caerostris extrusa]
MFLILSTFTLGVGFVNFSIVVKEIWYIHKLRCVESYIRFLGTNWDGKGFEASESSCNFSRRQWDSSNRKWERLVKGKIIRLVASSTSARNMAGSKSDLRTFPL